VLAVAIELRDPRVAVAIGHVDVALRVPRNVGRPVEVVTGDTGSLGWRRTCRGRTGCASAATATTAIFTAATACAARHVDRLRLPAHRHHDAAFGIELDHHVRALL